MYIHTLASLFLLIKRLKLSLLRIQPCQYFFNSPTLLCVCVDYENICYMYATCTLVWISRLYVLRLLCWLLSSKGWVILAYSFYEKLAFYGLSFKTPLGLSTPKLFPLVPNRANLCMYTLYAGVCVCPYVVCEVERERERERERELKKEREASDFLKERTYIQNKHIVWCCR